MKEKVFTPALGYRFLTPVYDLAVALLTREQLWRTELLNLVDPQPGDRILDVGCGTGSLIAQLSSVEPEAQFIGLDPDPGVLEIAQRKAEKAGAKVTWKNGFLDRKMVASIGQVSKVVCSLVFHQTPVAEKRAILSAMYSVLRQGGQLYIADYGFQRTRLMRGLFRWTVQLVDGAEDTQPNADGCLPGLIEAAGFSHVTEADVISTATGSISLYRASIE